MSKSIYLLNLSKLPFRYALDGELTNNFTKSQQNQTTNPKYHFMAYFSILFIYLYIIYDLVTFSMVSYSRNSVSRRVVLKSSITTEQFLDPQAGLFSNRYGLTFTNSTFLFFIIVPVALIFIPKTMLRLDNSIFRESSFYRYKKGAIRFLKSLPFLILLLQVIIFRILSEKFLEFGMVNFDCVKWKSSSLLSPCLEGDYIYPTNVKDEIHKRFMTQFYSRIIWFPFIPLLFMILFSRIYGSDRSVTSTRKLFYCAFVIHLFTYLLFFGSTH